VSFDSHIVHIFLQSAGEHVVGGSSIISYLDVAVYRTHNNIRGNKSHCLSAPGLRAFTSARGGERAISHRDLVSGVKRYAYGRQHCARRQFLRIGGDGIFDKRIPQRPEPVRAAPTVKKVDKRADKLEGMQSNDSRGTRERKSHRMQRRAIT